MTARRAFLRRNFRGSPRHPSAAPLALGSARSRRRCPWSGDSEDGPDKGAGWARAGAFLPLSLHGNCAQPGRPLAGDVAEPPCGDGGDAAPKPSLLLRAARPPASPLDFPAGRRLFPTEPSGSLPGVSSAGLPPGETPSMFSLWLPCCLSWATLLLALWAPPGGSQLSPEKSLAWGPGLRAQVVLPARYFYIQAVDTEGNR